jgi:ferrous iron transport protein B
MTSFLPPQATAALQSSPKNATRRVLLAGNPNVGKSVIFNALTGLYTNVSNFPGTTVDIPKGKFDEHTLIEDTPGVYGLSGLNDEETIAEKALMQATHVINVVNANTLERDLFLTQQLIDFGLPIILVLNQMDILESSGRQINTDKLSELMNVLVIPCSATMGDGIDTLKASIDSVKVGNPTPDMIQGPEAKAFEENPAKRMHVYGLRRQHVTAIANQVTTSTETEEGFRASASTVIGQALLHPVWGTAALVLVLAVLYQVIGIWVAGDLVNITEGMLMLGVVVPWVQQTLSQWLPTDGFIYTLLAGEFGVLTMSIQYIFGVLFPLVAGFYLYMAVLEDSGYLPRIATLSDTLLSRIGLNGRAIIPMLLGFGCVTMATVATRMLSSQRERTIASTLLAVTIPCSAQLAVIMALMAVAGGLKGWFTYLAILFGLMALIGAVLNQILPGKTTPLILDLPPVRMPQPKNVLKKTWIRTRGFLEEAAPLFVLGSAIVATLQLSGLLTTLQTALEPVTVNLLHLPPETAFIFIMGTVRRDFGAAGLLNMATTLTHVQILTALITITLFVPCIASAVIFWKERGIKEASAIFIGSWFIAFGTGFVVCRILEWIPLLG